LIEYGWQPTLKIKHFLLFISQLCYQLSTEKFLNDLWKKGENV